MRKKGRKAPLVAPVAGRPRRLSPAAHAALFKRLARSNHKILKSGKFRARIRGASDADRLDLLENLDMCPHTFVEVDAERRKSRLPLLPSGILDVLARYGGEKVQRAIVRGLSASRHFLPALRVLWERGFVGVRLRLAAGAAGLPDAWLRRRFPTAGRDARIAILRRKDPPVDLVQDALLGGDEVEQAYVAERLRPSDAGLLRWILDSASGSVLLRLAANPLLPDWAAFELCAKAKAAGSDEIALQLIWNEGASNSALEPLAVFPSISVRSNFAGRPVHTPASWCRLACDEDESIRIRVVRRLARMSAHERLAVFQRAADGGLEDHAQDASKAVSGFLVRHPDGRDGLAF